MLAAKSFQSCPTLCNPIDGSPPGSPVPGILQAKRLLKFLDYFLAIDSEMIPKNSIIREFIGGSCLKV